MQKENERNTPKTKFKSKQNGRRFERDSSKDLLFCLWHFPLESIEKYLHLEKESWKFSMCTYFKERERKKKKIQLGQIK